MHEAPPPPRQEWYRGVHVRGQAVRTGERVRDRQARQGGGLTEGRVWGESKECASDTLCVETREFDDADCGVVGRGERGGRG